MIISVRDSPCLYYIDLLSDYKVTEISLNSNNDTYVSFTILDLKVSYNQKYLGTINDKGTIIIYQLHSNNIVLFICIFIYLINSYGDFIIMCVIFILIQNCVGIEKENTYYVVFKMIIVLLYGL